MRKRQSYRVCRCTPDGCMTHLESRLLHSMVNRTIHPIRCAASARQKGMVAIRLGDLCAQSGHTVWALKVWRMAQKLIIDQDYNEWIDVTFNTERVRLGDVVAEDLCIDLGRRIDEAWHRLGHDEMAHYEQYARDAYEDLWWDKYWESAFTVP